MHVASQALPDTADTHSARKLRHMTAPPLRNFLVTRALIQINVAASTYGSDPRMSCFRVTS